MNSRIGESNPYIRINDIFEELSEENKRLNEELIFANNCLNVLNKFKLYLNKIYDKFEEIIDWEDRQELNQLKEEFNSVNDCKHQKNDTNVEELTKTVDSKNSNKTNDQNIKVIEFTNKRSESVPKFNNNETDYEMSDESDDQINDYSEEETKSTTDKTSIQSFHIKEESLQYNECGNEFAVSTSLNDHKEIHSNEWFKCDFVGCGEKFNELFLLTNHIRRIHTLEGPFNCDDCDKTFVTTSKLKNHQSIHSNQTLECKECHKLFKGVLLLKIHRREHLMKANICCDLCDFKTHSRDNLKLHIKRIHTLERPFKCDECDKAFVYNCELKDHQSIHLGHTFECEECHKVFKREKLFKRHRRRHLLKPDICCNLCDFKTRFRDNLKLHIKRMHTLEKPFKCDECDQTFVSNPELKDHQLIHLGHTFECEECHKVFKKERLLKIHQTRHLLEYISCDLCDFKSKYRDNLRDHIKRMHTLEKPFKCDECDKTFVSDSDLKDHQSIHSGLTFYCKECNKVFKKERLLRIHKTKHCVYIYCDYCDFKTKYRDNMNDHIRVIHSLEKHFICKKCGQTYATEAQLTEHLRTTHSNLKIKCDFCDFETKHKSYLNVHISRMHSMEENTIKCDYENCHQMFNDITLMKRHKKNKHTNNFISCDWPGCEAQVYRYKMDVHIRRFHTLEKPFKCEECDKTFATKNQLKPHKLSVHSGKKLSTKTVLKGSTVKTV